MVTIPIRSATPYNEDQTIAIIVLAFSADPIARWIYPSPYEYLSYAPDLVRAFAGNAFEHGTAYCVDGFLGAALCLPPDVQPQEEEVTTILERTVPKERIEEIISLLGKAGRYHTEGSHWHIPFIGVDPTLQGRGYASALMRHVLARCDKERQVIYLESTNPMNIPFYKHHGFDILGTVQVGTSPPVYPMMRRPQTT